jgi:hypothetical protein
MLPKTPRSQWRDRGGLEPPSLFCPGSILAPAGHPSSVMYVCESACPVGYFGCERRTNYGSRSRILRAPISGRLRPLRLAPESNRGASAA